MENDVRVSPNLHSMSSNNTTPEPTDQHAMTLRLPLTLAQSVADAAEALGTSRSHVIRLFILRGLEEFSTLERPIIQRMQDCRAHGRSGFGVNPTGT